MPTDSLYSQAGETGVRTNDPNARVIFYDQTADVWKFRDDSGTIREIAAVASGVSASALAESTYPLRRATGSITNAEMLALRATPKTLVAAPAAGFAHVFESIRLFFDFTGAYTETADNMAVKYTDGSGTTVSDTIESTGFVDAAADASIVAGRAASPLLTAAAALVLHNTGDGEFGGGNAANVIGFEVFYRTVPTTAI